jgi:hypothetical protein
MLIEVGNACQVTDESTESRMRRGKRCKSLRPESLSVYACHVKCLWHSKLRESMRHFNCTLPRRSRHDSAFLPASTRATPEVGNDI